VSGWLAPPALTGRGSGAGLLVPRGVFGVRIPWPRGVEFFARRVTPGAGESTAPARASVLLGAGYATGYTGTGA